MTMTAIAPATIPPTQADANDRLRAYRYQGEIMTHRVDDVRIREIKELAPVVYQEVDGARRSVASRGGV